MHVHDGPENEAQARQEAECLQGAMAKLSKQQRLLLNLRFRQGLTLDRISKIMRLGDPFRVRRIIQTALDAMAGDMKTAFSINPRKR